MEAPRSRSPSGNINVSSDRTTVLGLPDSFTVPSLICHSPKTIQNFFRNVCPLLRVFAYSKCSTQSTRGKQFHKPQSIPFSVVPHYEILGRAVVYLSISPKTISNVCLFSFISTGNHLDLRMFLCKVFKGRFILCCF